MLNLLVIWRYAMIPFKRYSRHSEPATAFFCGFNDWKTFLADWVPGVKIKRYNGVLTYREYISKWKPWILWDKRSKVYVWSYKSPPFLDKFCERNNVPLIRVEDGFLRSVALGAEHAHPISMTFAEKAPYFDATKQSDLEYLIQTYDFENDHALMARARAGIRSLIDIRLSKYNVAADADVEKVYGPKVRKRILVLGQVEGDMSIVKGCELNIDNNRLVLKVARENPEAQIIYKPHPEVIRGLRLKPVQTNPNDVRGVALVLSEDITLADALKTIDHAYTITSLSGFEALIRGIPVTCIGMPFYAGWGATEDCQVCRRRTAKRTVEQIFAAAYILHPKYFDPISMKYICFEDALDLLSWMKKASPKVDEVLVENRHERILKLLREIDSG